MSSAPRSKKLTKTEPPQHLHLRTHTHKHTNRQVPQSQEEKNSLSSVIFAPIVWPHLLWSDTLTRGLSSVVPPGVCTGAAPHSPRVLGECCKKKKIKKCHQGVTKVLLTLSLKKFLQARFFHFHHGDVVPWRSDQKRSRKGRRGIFFGNEWRHEWSSSGVKKNDSKGTGKKRGGGEAHWVSRCSDSRG